MNWRFYFASTIADRGYQYYRRGLVQNVEKNDEKYTAEVIGTSPYEVSVWKKANNQLGMKCSCPYALEGKKCKHMAALCAYLDSNLKEEKVFATQATPKESWKVDTEVQPFAVKNVPGEKNYTYFDLGVITRGVTIMNSQLEEARKLIEQGDIELKNVNISSGIYYDDGEQTGKAVAFCKDKRGLVVVSVIFTPEQIFEANCGVSGCNCSYSYYTRYYRTKLCKHQVATLLLLEEFIEKNNPGDSTDQEARRMMKLYRNQNRSSVLRSAEEIREDLQLEPKLELTADGLELSFRAGVDKLYVVKKLEEFVENVENGQVQLFGTKTELHCGLHKIAPTSQKYYQLLKRYVREEQMRSEMMGYYDEPDIGSKILLYGSRLDEVYGFMQEGTEGLPFQNKLQGKKLSILRACDRTPELELTLTGNYVNDALKSVRGFGEFPEIFRGEESFYFLQEPYLCRMEDEKARALEPILEMGMEGVVEFEIGRKYLAEFYYHTLPQFSEHISIVENLRESVEEYLPPKAVFRFYLDEEKDAFYCKAVVAYGEAEFFLSDYESANYQLSSLRDFQAEDEVISSLFQYFALMDREKQSFVSVGDEAAYRLLESGIGELMTFGEVHCTDSVKRIRLRKKTNVSVGVSLRSGMMELDITSEDLSIEDLLALLDSYRKKKKYHRLSNGDFINVNDDNIGMLAGMLDTLQVSKKEFLKGNIKVPAYRALYLDKVLEKNETLYVERDKHFKALIKEFKTVEDSEFELPKALQKVMRPYQGVGYKWLKTLEAYGFGGILADDMGLGKTLQVISVLLQAKEEKKKGTSLIISPASLIYNWQEEFHRFAPSLNTLVVNGTQQVRSELLADYEKYDVVITSYDLLKRDIGEYEGKQFLYQVIDEAQYIKNHTTIVAKAVKCIQSTTKYALTGTPIENRLSELWSIFDYLMPGFLYSYDAFRKSLEVPIAKNKEEEASKRLKRMVAPFILRRLKQDVLKDLPDKLEEIQYAGFEEKQRRVYDAQVVHMKGMLTGKSGEEFARDKIQILAELTKLRQICCDPSLLYDNFDGESAKRIACVDLVKRAIEGEHRVLIFSQFTSMLELLEEDMKKEGIPFYVITGATKKEDRVRLVKQFNEGDVPVFFISLKAGGTGLNLVGADTVIHYDPWWNQAVQNQATDRAHRIGQKKVVTVYKLIVKGTIEEKIVKLQEAKKNLADEILSGETGGLAQLSKEELLALLEA